jgi:hypothetical protein
MDGNLILSGDNDKQVSEWAVPKDVLLKDALKAQVAKVLSP